MSEILGEAEIVHSILMQSVCRPGTNVELHTVRNTQPPVLLDAEKSEEQARKAKERDYARLKAERNAAERKRKRAEQQRVREREQIKKRLEAVARRLQRQLAAEKKRREVVLIKFAQELGKRAASAVRDSRRQVTVGCGGASG
ncbi:hypothetical protein FGB62_21g454 [Gracilaria domingensis]|nr:hypothetical protein FGB62_21g454 [Gracilaria domingensis]